MGWSPIGRGKGDSRKGPLYNAKSRKLKGALYSLSIEVGAIRHISLLKKEGQEKSTVIVRIG